MLSNALFSLYPQKSVNFVDICKSCYTWLVKTVGCGFPSSPMKGISVAECEQRKDTNPTRKTREV